MYVRLSNKVQKEVSTEIAFSTTFNQEFNSFLWQYKALVFKFFYEFISNK